MLNGSRARMCEEHDATVAQTFHIAHIDGGLKCRNCIGGRSCIAERLRCVKEEADCGRQVTVQRST
jgi:hypothetical protein